MYGKIGGGTLAGGATATLPFTGLDTVGMIVAAVTLLFAGVALVKLVPKRTK